MNNLDKVHIILTEDDIKYFNSKLYKYDYVELYKILKWRDRDGLTYAEIGKRYNLKTTAHLKFIYQRAKKYYYEKFPKRLMQMEILESIAFD